MGETLKPVSTGFNRSLRIESRTDRLTGDAGAVVLREMLEGSGIVPWLTERIKDSRSPGAIAAAEAAARQAVRQRDQVHDALCRDLEAAQYATDRAFRQYDASDPENRLVTAELEARWSRMLQRAQEIEQKIAHHDTTNSNATTLPVEDLAALGTNLQRVWFAPGTDAKLKKRIVRTVIREVVADLDDDLRPEFVIVDGAPGLEAALLALWGDDLPIQRCTVHKHRNLLAHAPKHMHEELGNDYRDMIYADTAAEVETRRKAFLRKWRLKCRAVADSLEEAGDRLFFTRLDPSQWKAARTTNAIERLNEEFHRRIKTQAVLPCAGTVPMLLWALLASSQITMRKVDGWQTLDTLRANKSETSDRLKFTLDGAGKRTDGHALTDTAFAGCRL